MCLRVVPSVLPGESEVQLDIREHTGHQTMVQSYPLIVGELEKVQC